MRIVKEAEIRKNEILDAAEALFVQKGFDGTSTHDILASVGIARGTLYHHFKSKEDIMDALIDRYSVRLLQKAQQLADDKRVPVIDRMLNVIRSLNISGDGSKAVMTHIHKPQNALMHQKIQKMVVSGVAPIMAGIIREGIVQGVFDTPYPDACMEMIVIYATTVFDDGWIPSTDEEQAGRVQAFVFHIERLLGLKNGSLAGLMQLFEERTGEGSR